MQTVLYEFQRALVFPTLQLSRKQGRMLHPRDPDAPPRLQGACRVGKTGLFNLS